MPPKLPVGDTGVGTGGGVIGTIGAGAGFFATALFFAGVAFFIPFFLCAGAPRFAFLDFFALVFRFVFATFNLPIGSTKNMPTTQAARHHRSLLTLACAHCRAYVQHGYSFMPANVALRCQSNKADRSSWAHDDGVVGTDL